MNFVNKADSQNDNDDEPIFVVGSDLRELQKNRKLQTMFRALDEMETAFKCPICFGWAKNPVSIKPCGHTFCSECIRKSLKQCMRTQQSSLCPKCRTEVYNGGSEKSIAPCRGMEDAMMLWRSVRKGVYKRLMDSSETSAGSKKRSRTQEESSNNGADASSCCRNSTRRKSSRNIPPNSKVVDNGNSSDAFSNIEIDSDEELGDEKQNGQNFYVSAKREELRIRDKIPTPHYHGMKKQQLVALCNNIPGLSCKGSDRELKRRHENYIVLANAESDAKKPRNDSELAREIMHREEALKKEAWKIGSSRFDGYMVKLKASRKAAGENSAEVQVSSGNKEFDDVLKKGFKQLIENATQKNKAKNSSDDCRRSFLTDGADDTLPKQSTESNLPACIRECMNDPPIPNTEISPDYREEKKISLRRLTIRKTNNSHTKHVAKSSPPLTQWNCLHCTLINKASRFSCEVCGKPRKKR